MTLFAGAHLALSGDKRRQTLIEHMSEKGYLGLFSVIAAATLVWAIISYRSAPEVPLWDLGPGARWVSLVLTAVAVFFVTAGATTANPAMMGQEGAVEARYPPGIQSVTRHPVMWGVMLWAVAHLLVNGATAALILFVGLLVLAVLGTISQDMRMADQMGAKWHRYAAVTSHIPFAAILTRRTALDLAGIRWWHWAVALVVFLLLLGAHPFVMGVSPLPFEFM